MRLLWKENQLIMAYENQHTSKSTAQEIIHKVSNQLIIDVIIDLWLLSWSWNICIKSIKNNPLEKLHKQIC